MAYIPPNSTIKMLRGVPLNPDYEHTMYFNRTNQVQGMQDQYDYFNSFTVATYNNYMYVRKDRGVIWIKDDTSRLIDCNYLMYRNTAYDGQYRWFYAFVTKVDYVNDGTTKVEFELDIVQTWYWNFELGYCFVERQHVYDDTIGTNTVPENIELGEYVFEDEGVTTEFTGDWSIVIAATFSGVKNTSVQGWSFTDEAGGMYGGLYTGLYFNVFNSGSYVSTQALIDDVNSFLVAAVNAVKADGIVSVFMIPTQFTRPAVTSVPYSGLHYIPKDYNWTYYTGVSIKNKKLYTYPFNLFMVTDQQGSINEYRYEFFVNYPPGGSLNNCYYQIEALMSCSPECQFVPLYYNLNSNSLSTANYNEKMVINNFPQCAYNTDAYKAWLAQQGGVLGLTYEATKPVVNGAIGIASSMGNTNPIAGAAQMVSSISSAVYGVGDIVKETIIASKLPNTPKNKQSQGLAIASKTLGFRIYRCHVRPEYAKIIDDYFDKFGYAIHQNIVPNLRTRQRWTYIKTMGCDYTLNNMPADDIKTLTAIFDSGITFWAYRGDNDTFVCDYSKSNAPLGGS